MKNKLIKICGITDKRLAKMALKLGADYVGIVLTPVSRRCVSLEKAITIAETIREEKANPILVFKNESAHVIESIVKEVGDCRIQFQVENRKDIHRLLENFDALIACSSVYFSRTKDAIEKLFEVEGRSKLLLVDNQQPGSGQSFCWDNFNKPGVPWILAGGLNIQNIHQAINQLNPFGFDVSSGVENSLGIKDLKQIKLFIDAVRAGVK